MKRQRREILQQEINGLRNRIADTSERIQIIEKGMAEKARGYLRVQNPANVTINAGKAEIAQSVRAGVAGFNDLVDASIIKESSIAVKVQGNSAYYSLSEKRMHIPKSTRDTSRMVVHEMGHWLENTNPEVLAKLVEFYDGRMAGNPLFSPGQSSEWNEMYMDDRFIHNYMRKGYTNKAGERYATEILSMGLEYMYADPVTLATKDPDYFDFIFNLVRGQ
jgi:hypothetical protein